MDPPMILVRGRHVPDVNMRELQEAAFRQLVAKPTRLTGAEVRFIRKHLRMRQAGLAEALNMANHSVVSHWESREDESTGMAYNTEVRLRVWMAAGLDGGGSGWRRVWMAAKVGLGDGLLELLENKLKNLGPAAAEPLPVTLPTAA